LINSSKKDNNYLDNIILGKTSPNTNIGVTNENRHSNNSEFLNNNYNQQQFNQQTTSNFNQNQLNNQNITTSNFNQQQFNQQNQSSN
jgi:hypothetical protein